jgi:2-desacetyl-2-hydroxyethyl bacteriochlorophyllide A dehydrogenase
MSGAGRAAVMKSVVCSAPHSISVETRPAATRAEGDVLVQINRAGICGTDYHIYEGLHPFLKYPRVIGHELSGTVVEVSNGSKFAVGTQIVINPYIACGTCHACKIGKPNCCMNIAVLGVHRDGGMCDLISIPERNVIPANGLTLDEAATVEFLAIGAHAVRRSGVGKGSTALVVGAGPIGLGAAIFAQIAGAAVTLVDRDGERLLLAREATGISNGIVAYADIKAKIMQASNQDGFDVVLDATGNRTSMEQSFAYAAHGGTYVLVGLIKDEIKFSDPEFHKRELTLMGSRNATAVDFDHVIASIKSKKVPIAKLLTHRTSLANIAQDLPRWSSNKTGLIKAMVEIS